MPRNTTALRPLALFAASVAPLVCSAAAYAQESFTEELGASSTYTRESCLGICACHETVTPFPVTGTFFLQFDHADTWTNYYLVTNVDFTTRSVSEPEVHFSGSGTFHIGGDFALTQHLVLDLVQTNNGQAYHFDSGEVVITGGGVNFPAISINATTGVMGCSRRSFVISAAPGQTPPSCPADLGSAGGLPGADGHLDNNDFIAFINFFFNSDPAADLGQAGGLPGADGQFNNNDFIAFINLFFAGC